MSKPAGRSNLSDIDVFRGVAALIVAAMHTRETTWVGFRQFWNLHGSHAAPEAILGYLTFPLVWGSIGVPIFFVLSGYCIHRSQAIARSRTGSFQLSPTNFLVRRFFRIYPVLLGALLLTLLCDWASRHYFPNSAKLGDTGIGAFLVNLFSIQGIAGGAYGSNGPLWTLSIEVQFYLLYPSLLAIMGRLRNIPTLLLLIAVNIVSYFALERHGYQLFTSYYVSWYLGALVAEAECAALFSNRLQTSRPLRGVVRFWICWHMRRLRPVLYEHLPRVPSLGSCLRDLPVRGTESPSSASRTRGEGFSMARHVQLLDLYRPRAYRRANPFRLFQFSEPDQHCALLRDPSGSRRRRVCVLFHF